jgi:hypothetical protein
MMNVSFATAGPDEEKVASADPCAKFHKVRAGSGLLAEISAVAVAWGILFDTAGDRGHRVGLHLAPNGVTTKGGFDYNDSWNHMRESSPYCSRLVAAAGSLLNYWTDFGRLIT